MSCQHIFIENQREFNAYRDYYKDFIKHKQQAIKPHTQLFLQYEAHCSLEEVSSPADINRAIDIVIRNE